MGKRSLPALTIASGKLKKEGNRPPFFYHSDQGLQYGHPAYQGVLREYGFLGKLSGRAIAMGAIVESFFKTLKTECIRRERYAACGGSQTESLCLYGEVQCSRLFFLEIVFDNAQEVFGVGKDECFEKESPFLRRAASAA